jgi:hypothetical protein
VRGAYRVYALEELVQAAVGVAGEEDARRRRRGGGHRTAAGFFWEEQRQSDTCGSVRVPGPGLGLALLGLVLVSLYWAWLCTEWAFRGPKRKKSVPASSNNNKREAAACHCAGRDPCTGEYNVARGPSCGRYLPSHGMEVFTVGGRRCTRSAVPDQYRCRRPVIKLLS